MSNFVPPYPRLPRPPTPLRRLLLARQNVLAMWEEAAYKVEFGAAKLLTRYAFTCDSPEAVQFAFSLKNASVERKRPQMRYALEPLLGDGLFVSDGETWRKRRRIVAPTVDISRLAAFAPVMVEAALEARRRWEAQQGQTVDILAESAQLTAEIISLTILGRELGRDHARQIVDGFSEYPRLIGQIDPLSFLGLPDWFLRWYGRSVRRAAETIHAVIDDALPRLWSRDRIIRTLQVSRANRYRSSCRLRMASATARARHGPSLQRRSTASQPCRLGERQFVCGRRYIFKTSINIPPMTKPCQRFGNILNTGKIV